LFDDCGVSAFPDQAENGGFRVTAAAARRRDGKEIFYLSADNKVMAAKVETSGGSFAVGESHALFDSHSYGVFGRYDVSADGQHFVVVYEGSQPSTTLTYVANWPAELKKK
jgi:hypothetical protein